MKIYKKSLLMGSLARLGTCGFVLVKSYQLVVGNLQCFCLSAVRDCARPVGGNGPSLLCGQSTSVHPLFKKKREKKLLFTCFCQVIFSTAQWNNKHPKLCFPPAVTQPDRRCPFLSCSSFIRLNFTWEFREGLQGTDNLHHFPQLYKQCLKQTNFIMLVSNWSTPPTISKIYPHRLQVHSAARTISRWLLVVTLVKQH